MKKIITLGLIIWQALLYCQDLDENGKIKPTLPSVILPSEDNYYKTLFGNTEINLYRGFPVAEIPVATLKEGGVKVEVKLSYNRPGVKVAELPNVVGVNWILDTGGIITRTVYDKADERYYSTGNYLQNKRMFTLGEIQDLDGNRNLMADYVRLPGIRDQQVDIFNYSVAGHSGSFYLDENLSPVLLTKNNDLKIETVGDFKTTLQFVITTFEGKKYFFGGSEFLEKKRHKHATDVQDHFTAFFLSKIEDVATNSSIYFEYEERYVPKINYTPPTHTILGRRVFLLFLFGAYTQVASPPSFFEDTYKSNQIPDIYVVQLTTKDIKRIVTNNEKIEFTYSHNGLSTKLDKISLIKNGSLIKEAHLNYTLDKSNLRHFLTSVDYKTNKNNVSTIAEQYKMNYYGPLDLPQYFSNQVDLLGYYNGANSENSSRYYDVELFNSGLTNFFGGVLANRLPNFNYAIRGTLKSIEYPTRGKTVFEYESDEVRRKLDKTITIVDNDPDYVPTDGNIYTTSYDVTSNEFGELNFNYELLLEKVNSSSVVHLGKYFFRVIDLVTNTVVKEKEILITHANNEVNAGQNGPPYYQNYVTYSSEESGEAPVQLLPNRNYRIEYIPNTVCQTKCKGRAVIKYKSNWVNTEGGNIRLKRQYDISENDTVNYKRIYYSDVKNLKNNSILKDPILPKMFDSYLFDLSPKLRREVPNPNGEWYYVDTNDPQSTKSSLILDRMYNSNPLYLVQQDNTSNPDGNLVNVDPYNPHYNNVTISYGGENFEKGGEEKKFRFVSVDNNFIRRLTPEFGPITYFMNEEERFLEIEDAKRNTPITYSNLQGVEEYSNTIVKKGDSLYYQRKNSYEHTIVEEKSIYNLVGRKMFEEILHPSTFFLPGYHANVYAASIKYSTVSKYLNRIVSTEYIDGLPVDALDDASYKKITAITEYTYDNPINLTSKIKNIFADGSVTENTFTYAHDINNQFLITKGVVGVPIRQEKKLKKGASMEIVSKSEVHYPTTLAQAPSGLVVPLKETTYDIENGIEKDVYTYNLYDAKGNLLEYTDKEGVIYSIIWGYNNTLPIIIAKGLSYENYTQYPEILTAVNLSNQDDIAPVGSDESSLITALDNVRKKLYQYDVTTYTYDPLIGVRSVTPPTGISEIYIYDGAHRLEKIVNAEGEILKEFMYNYKD